MENDMEQILLKTAEQVPNLAVLTLIVWIFLRHIKEQSGSFHSIMTEIHDQAMTARERSREVIEKNTAAVAANSEVMRETTVAYRELVSKCRANKE